MLGGAGTDASRLFIGIDADAASMRAASVKVSRRKTAWSNAIFVVASADRLPDELTGVADRVSILFPWGSLLRGLVTGDRTIVGEIARLASPGADVTAMWSIAARDTPRLAVEPLPNDRLGDAFDAVGMTVFEVRPASRKEAFATGSTWAKRLLAGDASRPVTLLRAEKR